MKTKQFIAWVAAIVSGMGCASAQIVSDGSFTDKGATNGNSVYSNGGFNNGGTTIGFWSFKSTSGNGEVAPLHATPLGTTDGSGIIISSQSSAPGENAICQQTISVTAGTKYNLTFNYESTTSTDNGGMLVYYDGTLLATLAGTLTNTQETLTFTGVSGSQLLTFENNHTDNHTSNASVEFNNVVVTAAPTTPEPSSVIAVTFIFFGICVTERKRFGRVLQNATGRMFGSLKKRIRWKPIMRPLTQP